MRRGYNVPMTMTYDTGIVFKKFYDAFVANAVHRKRWTINLADGAEISGVPRAGSIVNLADPVFTFKSDDGHTFSIQFSYLLDARPCL